MADSAPTPTPLEVLLERNRKQTRLLFGGKRARDEPEPEDDEFAMAIRRNTEYKDVLTLPPALAAKLGNTTTAVRKRVKKPAAAAAIEDGTATTPTTTNNKESSGSSALIQVRKPAAASASGPTGDGAQTTSLMRMSEAMAAQPKPEWHKPWKLHKVISGHLGWVRSVAVEPNNKWFVTGSGDRTIKIWDLASGQLRLTLTGHISTVRGLAVSPRHPYLFSCGEDKMVKCWDLETNKVIRHYHGHLSGVYTLALHPTLDVLVTGGRDGVARVWDMRTRSNV